MILRIWVLLILFSSQLKKDLHFSYYDQLGNEFSTQKFDGCVVFISFWSKSCAPCIRGFKESEDLREKLLERGVILLNASIDNKSDWDLALRKYEPVGENVRLKDFQKTQKQFEIYLLPVYATLDGNGNQISYGKHIRGDIFDFEDWYSKN